VRPFSSVARYRAGQKPLADVARELGVDALVQGSVTRSGDRIRITGRLTDPWHGRVIWVESYDTNLLDLSVTETQLARLIGHGVHANFDAEEERFFTQTSHRLVPAAHEAYLQGHYLLTYHRNGNEVRQSCNDFERAIAADPDFSPAYAGMAQCQQWLETRRFISFEESQTESFAMKAVQLDPLSAKAHAVLGSTYLYHNWNWPAAEQELRRAVQVGPNDAEAHFLYSEYLKVMGRLPEALVEIRRAQELDPLEFHYLLSSGYFLLYMHHFDEAEVEFKQVLQAAPDNLSAVTGLAEAYEKRQMLKQAAECWQTYVTEEDEQPNVAPFMETYGKQGFLAAKQQYLEARIRLEEGNLRRGASWAKLDLAYLNAMLGRKRQALAFLQLAYAAHLTPLINLKIDSRFDVLRDQPEFRDLLQQMKLADQTEARQSAPSRRPS
jgi:Tfp pilus assembly protein PilF